MAQAVFGRVFADAQAVEDVGRADRGDGAGNAIEETVAAVAPQVVDAGRDLDGGWVNAVGPIGKGRDLFGRHGRWFLHQRGTHGIRTLLPHTHRHFSGAKPDTRFLRGIGGKGSSGRVTFPVGKTNRL